MSVQTQQQFLTIETYLDFENSAETKHEFYQGEIVAMTGASTHHNLIAGNTFAKLYNQLSDSPCRVFMADMKLKIGEDVFYPDVMVVCNQDDANDMYKTAPVLIVEVLSNSTRKLDHTYKRLRYQNIPSLEEYVLMEQDKAEVTVFSKREGWYPAYYYLGDEIRFESLGVTVSVEELYRRVNTEDVLAFVRPT